MNSRNDFMILFFISSVLLGAVLGWTVGQGASALKSIAESGQTAVWASAFGTISAAIVAVGFGVVTHRRETQWKKKERADRIDRASALATVFDHELHMASGIATLIRENINDEYIERDIEELTNLVNDGLAKIALPLLNSFLNSLSDFSPQTATALLVVVSRQRQMEHNGPVPFGNGIQSEVTARSLRVIKQLIDRWIHDILDARIAIKPYHKRIAEIEVRPIEFDRILHS